MLLFDKIHLVEAEKLRHESFQMESSKEPNEIHFFNQEQTRPNGDTQWKWRLLGVQTATIGRRESLGTVSSIKQRPVRKETMD